MKNTKQILAQIGITIVVVLIGFIIFDKKIGNNLLEIEQKINLNENQVQTGNVFDLNTFESLLTENLNNSSKSVVNILATKNLKYYFENSNTFGPGTINEQEAQVGGGSGIIGSKDGYIITSKHVVQDENSQYSVITKDNKTYKVDKIWFDPKLDLAVIKILDENGNIPRDLEPAKFISIEKETKIGQFVFAIGNIMNEYQNSVTAGILSAKNRNFTNYNDNLYIGLYQTDAYINAGNSGGPLLNINGEVIGINTAVISFEKGLGFAMPVSQEMINNTINSITSNGKIIRPEIGFDYVDITNNSKRELKLDLDNGIYVKSILSGSSVQVSGLLPGDIITKINNLTIKNDLPFIYQLYTFKAGDKLDIEIIRNGDKKTITMINTD